MVILKGIDMPHDSPRTVRIFPDGTVQGVILRSGSIPYSIENAKAEQYSEPSEEKTPG